MPRAFFGMVKDGRARCGICQRVATVSTVKRHANQELRREGWTWREDTGWSCTCRHRCANLDPSRDPLTKARERRAQRKAQRGPRRYPKPSGRIRGMIRRRNRTGIE